MMRNSGPAPEAFMDIVGIFRLAPLSALPLSVAELHLFAYLARIVSLFDGSPTAEWGYDFVVTGEGFPFSVELDEARKTAVTLGLITETDEGEAQADAEAIAAEYDTLTRLSDLAKRSAWLKAAMACSLSLPSGTIRTAVNHSPGVMSASAVGQRRQLMQPMDVDTLYAQYRIVTQALGGQDHGLLAPAVLWLSAYVMDQKIDAHAI